MPAEVSASPLRLLAPCTGPLAFIDYDEIIYISARVVVIFNRNDQTQTFLPPRNSSYTISSFCISLDGQVLATLEVGPKSNLVIYELKPTRRRKTIAINTPIEPKDNSVAFAFSPDGKLLATLLPDMGTPLSYSVVIYMWRTGKIVASLSFNPMDIHCLAIVYNGVLRYYRMTPDGLECGIKPKLAGHVITCHSWLASSKLVVGTKGGQVIVIEDADIVTTVFPHDDTDSPTLFPQNDAEQMTWKDKSQPPVINAVCPIGSNQIGYLVDNDVVMVSEAIDGKGTFYQPSATFSRKINGDTPDVSDVSIRRFSLVASTSHTNKIIAVVINGQIWTSQVYDQTSAQCGDPTALEPLLQMGHTGAIRGVSTALWQPYAVTVGSDRYVHLWNVSAGKVQFSTQVDEDVLGVSLHPMGHYVAIATLDSIQVFSVLVDRFHLSREVILAGCHKLCFNSGGNWMAVTRGANLQLVNFITFETSSSFLAHKADINQIAWSEDGQQLYSCGADGLLCEWDITTQQVRMQVKPNGPTASLLDLIVHPNGNVLVVCDDGSILEVGTTDGNILNRVGAADLYATCICYLGGDQTVLVGTKSGAIRSYKYPINNRSEYQETSIQIGSISQICETSVGLEGETLISCSEDGSICLWKLSDDLVKSHFSHLKVRSEADRLNVECLVLRGDWLNHNRRLDNAMLQVDEVRRQTQLQIQIMEQDNAQQRKVVELEHCQQFERANRHIQELESKLTEHLEQSHQQMSQMRSDHEKDRRRLEDNHHSKLAAEFKQHDQLEAEIVRLHRKRTKDMEELESKLKTEFSERESQLMETIESNTRSFEEQKKQLTKKVSMLEAALKGSVDKIQADERSLQSRHQAQLNAEKQVNLKLRAESALLKKNVTSLQKEVECLRLASQNQETECRRLTESLTISKQETKQLQDELQQKDNFIRIKDGKLQKVYTQLQQKDKAETDFKSQLALMSKTLDQGQTEMSTVLSKLEKAEIETKSSRAQVDQLNRNIDQLLGKGKSQSSELLSLRRKFQNQQGRLQEILVCLDVGMTYLHDHNQLKEYFAAIHDVYCDKEQSADPGQEPATTHGRPSSSTANDWIRKVESLENTISSLRHQLSETIKTNQAKQDKLRKDNSLLLNQLRQSSTEIAD